jgi:hypothetical protein
LQIIPNKIYMAEIRIVPIQQLCVLWGDELQARNATQGLAARLCGVCIQLLHEQVFFESLSSTRRL